AAVVVVLTLERGPRRVDEEGREDREDDRRLYPPGVLPGCLAERAARQRCRKLRHATSVRERCCSTAGKGGGNVRRPQVHRNARGWRAHAARRNRRQPEVSAVGSPRAEAADC